MTTPARMLALPALLVLLSVAPFADAPDIQTLKNLKFTNIEVPGARITQTMGINNFGHIVGSWEDSLTRQGHGFVFREGAYTSIDVPGAVSTAVYDINDAGDIVGTYSEPAGPGQLFGDSHGFLLTADDELTTITAPGQRVTWAFGINNQGQIVGGYSEWDGAQVLGVHSFMFENGSFTPIDFPVSADVPVTYASGINDRGDIVGGYNDDDIFQSRRGFVFRDGEYSTFDVPGSGFTELLEVNNTGEIVGEYSDSQGGYSFLFSPSRGFRRLASTGNPKTRFAWLFLFDINDSGQIAGASSTADGSQPGFVAELSGGW